MLQRAVLGQQLRRELLEASHDRAQVDGHAERDGRGRGWWCGTGRGWWCGAAAAAAAAAQAPRHRPPRCPRHRSPRRRSARRRSPRRRSARHAAACHRHHSRRSVHQCTCHGGSGCVRAGRGAAGGRIFAAAPAEMPRHLVRREGHAAVQTRRGRCRGRIGEIGGEVHRCPWHAFVASVVWLWTGLCRLWTAALDCTGLCGLDCGTPQDCHAGAAAWPCGVNPREHRARMQKYTCIGFGLALFKYNKDVSLTYLLAYLLYYLLTYPLIVVHLVNRHKQDH